MKRFFQFSISVTLLLSCAVGVFLLWHNFTGKNEKKRLETSKAQVEAFRYTRAKLDEYYQNEWYILLNRCAYSKVKRGGKEEIALVNDMKNNGYDELGIKIMSQNAIIKTTHEIMSAP
jgi:hypothetical protein